MSAQIRPATTWMASAIAGAAWLNDTTVLWVSSHDHSCSTSPVGEPKPAASA